jgi:serine/threonine protein phosphatase PrpC
MVGSTAVITLLVDESVLVANCGDSRTVLCRGTNGSPPVPLSFDHKVRHARPGRPQATILPYIANVS